MHVCGLLSVASVMCLFLMSVPIFVFLTQRDEEVQKLKGLASFKAQFPNVLANKPFVPAKSKRPLTGNVMLCF